MTDEETADEFLSRFRVRTDKDLTKKEFAEIIDSQWQHRHSPTQKQLDALRGAWKLDRNFVVEEAARKEAEKHYVRTRSGGQIPRLASKGIRRITYVSGGRRQTRYQVPGRRGLFSLSTARDIFTQI